MAEAVNTAKIRHWRETKRWRKDHPAKGIFPAVVAGQVEELRLPVFMHPCHCGAWGSFGVNGIWFCKDHRP